MPILNYTTPQGLTAPTIEAKSSWSDDWNADPSYVLVAMARHASSITRSTCTIERRYGPQVMTPADSALTEYDAQAADGWWIRVTVASTVVFMGQIDDSADLIQGQANAPAGRQTWVACDGLHTLQKILISQAIFLDSSSNLQTVDWVPPMNVRDRRGLMIGNRSANSTDDNIYYYGGSSTWTHKQYIEYILDQFVEQEDGPTWELSDTTGVLADLQTAIRFPDVISAAEMLRQLIPLKYGIDYYVAPNSDQTGWVVTVFALQGTAQTFGSATMPANPTALTIYRDQDLSLAEARIVQSSERKVDQIVVQGKRIVVCGTLWGSQAPSGGATSLIARWGSSVESDYVSAGGQVSAQPNLGPPGWDKIRRGEKYREVYSHFGTPENWDMNNKEWSVACNADGTLTTGDHQCTIRETLHWLPLKLGWDYTQQPPVDNTYNTNDEPEMSHPLAWIQDANPDDGSNTPKYVPADRAGIHIGTPYHDWGIMLHGDPAHKVCLNHWTNDQLATSELEYLRYDYNTLIATIAIESDHRLSLTYTLTGDLAAGDGSRMVILDEEAECWILLGGTIVDVDPTSGNPKSSGGTQQVLRNDSDKLALVMAGTIARYTNDRVKGTFTWRGLQPATDMLGTILSVVVEGDDVTQVGAVITSMEWSAQPIPTTIVRTGYS